MKDKTVRIAGTQGFYGDSPMGALMVAHQHAADYLMHDALAELTLSILQKDKLRDPNLGYARDIELHAARLYPVALSKGMKIVTNSGGLNPESAVKTVATILKKKGISNVKIASISGDNFLEELDTLQDNGIELIHIETGENYNSQTAKVTHANAYIGAWAIKEALKQGADIILAGRVADPCLALGILAYEFDWEINSDYLNYEMLDRMANAIMIGHIIECGGQASGGNSYAEWQGRDYTFGNLGYPIAHVKEDGSAIITKAPNTGGKVSRNTVREQLVYEIHDPSNYITPDVIVDLSNIKVEDLGDNKVAVSGAQGRTRPRKLKLCIGQMEGYLTEHLFYFSWPYAYDKAQAFVKAAHEIWAMLPIEYQEVRINYLGINGVHEDAAPKLDPKVIEDMNEVGIRIAIQHQDKKVGKMMIQSIICLALNGPPGITASINWGKMASVRLGLFPCLIPRGYVQEKIEITSI